MATANAKPRLGQIYPPDVRDALMRAAAAHDGREIDRLTDQLALRGLCRPRESCRAEFDARPAAHLWQCGVA